MSAESAIPLTVVVPVFNKRATIARCLKSISAQTAKPFEIVVVDDASTDDSVAIIRSLQVESAVPIRLVQSQTNKGAGASRNIGIRNARSEWLAFLDADDFWSPEFCERVWQAVQREKSDFGAAAYVIKDRRKPNTKDRTSVVPDREARQLDVLFWRRAINLFPINSSSALVNKNLAWSLGGFPEDVRSYEDVTLWARLWLNGRFTFVNEPLSFYERIPGGVTSRRKANRDVGLFLYRFSRVVMSAVRRRRPGASWAMLFLCHSLTVWPLSAARTWLMSARIMRA